MKDKECKFYKRGKCTHRDALPSQQECIGKKLCGVWHDDISYQINTERLAHSLNKREE